jgi:hypothetical protein
VWLHCGQCRKDRLDHARPRCFLEGAAQAFQFGRGSVALDPQLVAFGQSAIALAAQLLAVGAQVIAIYEYVAQIWQALDRLFD